MDIAVFDAALSYTADSDNISSITIVELKRPQRDDANNDPVLQVLKYERDIKAGKIKKKNGCPTKRQLFNLTKTARERLV